MNWAAWKKCKEITFIRPPWDTSLLSRDSEGRLRRTEQGGTSRPTHHQHFLVAFVDGVVVDHAHNGYAQIAPDAERDAEAQAGQDGDDVAARQPKAGAIHDGQLLLLHQLGTSLRRQLDSLAIGLPLLDQPEGGM